MGSEFLQPPGWAAPKGYSNGVSARGRQIYLAGLEGQNLFRGRTIFSFAKTFHDD